MNKENGKQYISVALSSLFCVVSLIPLMYCAMFDYATGDDLIKSASVHRLIVNGASFVQIIAQAGKEAAGVWRAHEGTWASNFILALQPGIWGEKYYVVTPFIGLFFLFGGVGIFLHEIIVKSFGYSKKVFFTMFFVLMIIMTQYMPFIRGGLFWFTGMAHYTIPFGMALLLLTLDIKYLKSGSVKLVPFMILISIYIGGSHYQAILLVLILQVVFSYVFYNREKKIYLYSIANQILFELIGLAICAKAPGNAERAGDEFSFSTSRALYTIVHSIEVSFRDGIDYFVSIKLIPVYMLLVIAFVVMTGKTREKKTLKKYPLVIVLAFLTYCAMYSPGIYYSTFGADEGISGGFYDFNYFSFLLFLTIAGIIIGEIATFFIKNEMTSRYALGIGVISLGLFVVSGKSIVKESADYMIYTFVSNGHLKDYDNQMKERLRILQDDTVKNVILPEMNNEQGPFMHMAITKDVDNFSNTATMSFYDKESVIAIPRDEYYEKYENNDVNDQ